MSARSDLVRRVALGASLLGMLAAVVDGCGFPDYTYDLPEGTSGSAGADSSTDVVSEHAGGSAGQGGASGSGGSAGEAGSSGAGGGDLDASDAAEADATDDQSVGDADAEADAVEDDSSADVVSEEAAADADAEAEAEAAVDAPPEADAADASDAPDVTDAADVFDAPPDIVEAASDCTATPEDCTNGVDDDCDGKIDCADTVDCSPLYKCVTAPPAGWNGWYQLYEGAAGVAPVECAAPFAIQEIYAGANPVSTPATCSGCQCDTPTGIQCTEPNIVIWQGTDCDGSGWQWADEPPSTPLTQHNKCLKYNLTCSEDGGVCNEPPGSTAMITPAQMIAGTGTCQFSGGVPTKLPADFQTVSAACKADFVGGGCGSGVCAPKPSNATGVKPGVCIYKAGVEPSCPTGSYSERFVYYKSVTDTRSCTACSCGYPQDANCQGTFTVAASTQTNCLANPEVSFSDVGVCHTGISPEFTKYLRYDDPASLGGYCVPSGGAPTGDVVPNNSSAYTFCCVPY